MMSFSPWTMDCRGTPKRGIEWFVGDPEIARLVAELDADAKKRMAS